jgi:class 3 adenylate cyclase
VEAERRQVTVLFADMVGFTSFSERSGEEAAYTLMRNLSKLMDEAVREQGGFVRGFTGDGIMAVFGAPVAFEDAPLRACHAALSILQRLTAAGPDFEAKHGVRPQLRIGLNTGAAVVGKVDDSAEAGATVLGDTVNFAARLQALAEPDSIFNTPNSCSLRRWGHGWLLPRTASLHGGRRDKEWGPDLKTITLYAAKGRRIPLRANSPTGSTFTAFSTFVSTLGLMRIWPGFAKAADLLRLCFALDGVFTRVVRIDHSSD